MICCFHCLMLLNTKTSLLHNDLLHLEYVKMEVYYFFCWTIHKTVPASFSNVINEIIHIIV